MGQSAEELRAEIAETRAQMSGTVDAIGDRVSPGRMMERRKNRFTHGVRSIRDRVMGTIGDAGHAVTGSAQTAVDKVHHATDSMHQMPDAIRDRSQGSPMTAGGIAFGLGFLVAVALPPSRTEREATASLMDRAGPVKDEVTHTARAMVEDLKEPAKNALGEVKEAASDAAAELSDTAKNAAQQTKSEATSIASDLRGS